MLLLKFLNQFVPFFFLLRAAFDRLSKMRERFVGNVKELVFGPAEMALGLTHGIFARRVAVRFARSGSGHAVTNRRLHRDQRRPIGNRLCVANRGFDGGEIVSVLDGRSMPAVSFKALWHIFGKSERSKAFNRYVIVVVKINQFAKLQMSGERRGFRGDS